MGTARHKKHRTKRSRNYTLSSHKAIFTRYARDSRYARDPQYLSLPAFKQLLKNEYKCNFSPGVMNACYHTWFQTLGTKKILTKTQFIKMYKQPDGFLRDFK